MIQNKAKFIVFFGVFCLFLAHFSVFSAENKDFSRFLDTLGKIESGNNDCAVGDNGKAIGRYQIWESYFKDAKQFDKSLQNFNYQDVTNKVVADMVVRAYCKRYERKSYESGDWETLARLHNSGQNWRNKKVQL